MIRGILAAFLLAGFAAGGASAQSNAPVEQQQLDDSRALFDVLAAINAAGYDADLDSPANSPVRAAVRAAIAAKNPSSLGEIRSFFAKHRQRDATAELTQYVSFALSINGPPDFAWRYKETELPPDAAQLDALRPLLARFDKEADLEALWQRAQPAFEEAIAWYHGPAMTALSQVNAYLRSSTSGPLGTRFQIYVSLLAAPNQVQTRSYKSDYFVVVTPSAEPQAAEVRHGYLHYMLDALSIRFAADLEKKKALLDYAQGAPLLEDYYKNDFSLLATESLIKAVESRLAPAAQRAGLVEQALREGYILTPAFAEALPAYEKQEQSLRFYYPNLVGAIDLKREEQRFEKVEFATERPGRKAKEIPAQRPVEATGVQKTLEDAERLYAARDLDKAKATYLRALQETDQKPLHAKAYYGLARIAALQRDPETAEKFFEKALQSEPGPQEKAWAYVYLGRLADAAGQREQATGNYRAALAVDGAPGGARDAAEKGLNKAFQKQQ